jgi:hypothetical protein
MTIRLTESQPGCSCATLQLVNAAPPRCLDDCPGGLCSCSALRRGAGTGSQRGVAANKGRRKAAAPTAPMSQSPGQRPGFKVAAARALKGAAQLRDFAPAQILMVGGAETLAETGFRSGSGRAGVHAGRRIGDGAGRGGRQGRPENAQQRRRTSDLSVSRIAAAADSRKSALGSDTPAELWYAARSRRRAAGALEKRAWQRPLPPVMTRVSDSSPEGQR